jgi:glycogen synthase
MRHLLVCREYPPAPYPPGGIGSYGRHISHLLAEAGETVHVIAQRWEGAKSKTTESHGGRLIVHRVSADDAAHTGERTAPVIRGLTKSDYPGQAFSWKVAELSERLVESEGIDLIEASEWEAPLYYFQLRRALDLGPRRQPPCLIHLHSPSELIFRHNDWDRTLSDYQPLCRMEEYTVRAADGLVCPSRYLARQAERLFALTPDRVAVIPYPLGETHRLDRAGEVWARDSICYIGRLELRKGVVEWVDAGVAVAQSHPTVTFDFIGSDTSLNGGPGRSVRQFLNQRIPGSLRARFRFHGGMNREQLMDALAQAPAAVVPSRWENLPYACMEAMCTGAPVLVSPGGGMQELVVDGENGWVAADGTAAGLAAALRRFLGTPAAKRQRMGRQAEAGVRRICGSEEVLRRHLQLRKNLAAAGTSCSLRIPAGAQAALTSPQPRRGMAVAVSCAESPGMLSACLESVARQSRPARLVMVAGATPVPDAACLPDVEYLPAGSPAEVRQRVWDRVRQLNPPVRGIVFVDQCVRLLPEHLSVCETIFEQQPGAGLISSFVRHESRGNMVETPSGLGTDWSARDLDKLPWAAVRTEAWPATERAGAGWAALIYPDILSSTVAAATPSAAKRYSAMTLAQRGSARLTFHWFLAAPWMEKLRWAGRVLSQPRRAADRIAWHLRASAVRAR